MNRHDEIKNAYRSLGKEATFYDGMMTCSTALGKLICRVVWNMDKKVNAQYLETALSGVPENFSGKMLEVPVGTGVITMPVYKMLPEAEITCLDYSKEMMETAQLRRDKMGIKNIQFLQGDIGQLPFEDNSFDLVLSLNGFHVFPDKKAAYAEVHRVLRPGGIFCGCFYIQGENKRTDWFIEHVYVPKDFFTPPFETAESLIAQLKSQYDQVKVEAIESMACFTCVK